MLDTISMWLTKVMETPRASLERASSESQDGRAGSAWSAADGYVQVAARLKDRVPVGIVEVFEPQDVGGAVPHQRLVAALHRAMDLGHAQVHVPHGRDALGDEPGVTSCHSSMSQSL